jgi:hypothetical protein
MKATTYAILCIASSVLLISACGGAANTTTNNSTANSSTTTTTTNTSNTATAANTNKTAANNNAPASNVAPTPAAQPGGDKVDGELQVGKTESVILYLGQESGDYAGYCFKNDSDAGRAILAACKDREQCEVTGKVDYEAGCKVPGLEADLSGSGRILSVASARRIAGKKK